MNINLIKEKLESIGYLTILDKTGFLIVGQDSGDISELGWKLLKETFGVKSKDNKIILDYAIGQIPVEKEFTTIEAMLDFVKEVFLIEQ